MNEADEKKINGTDNAPKADDAPGKSAPRFIHTSNPPQFTRSQRPQRKIAESRVERTNTTDGKILIKADDAPDTYCDRFEEACLIRQATQDILPPGAITPDELKSADIDKTRAFVPAEPVYGIAEKKQRFIKTTESDPAHTMVFHDELWDTLERSDTKKRQIARIRAIAESGALEAGEIEQTEEVPQQLLFTGFEQFETSEKLDERKVEADLRRSRYEQAKSFNLYGENKWEDISEETETKTAEKEISKTAKLEAKTAPAKSKTKSAPAKSKDGKKGDGIVLEVPSASAGVYPEYRSEKDRKRISAFINVYKSKQGAKAVLFLILGFVSLLLPLFYKLGEPAASELKSRIIAAIIIQLIINAAAFIVALPELRFGFNSIRKKQPDANSGLLLLLTVTTLQCIVMLFGYESLAHDISLLSPAALLLCVPVFAGKYLNAVNMKRGFAFLTKNEDDLYTIADLSSSIAYADIKRLLPLENPRIKYSAKPQFISSFIGASMGDSLSAKLLSRGFALIAAEAIVAFLAATFKGDIFEGIFAMAALIVISFPVGVPLASVLGLLTENIKIASRCFITSFAAALSLTETDTFIIDANELFPASACDIHGIKTFGSMKLDEAILYIASTVIKSGGPLKPAFEKVIMGNNKLLLPVEALSYEDRLGLSAWIHEKRILIGNAQLLRNHSVKAPDERFESKYTEGGRRVVYLSVDGVLSAMFVVSYSPSAAVKKGLNALVNQGITVLVTSRDSNITEEFIESSFGTGKNCVRVINSASAEFFKECFENEKSKEMPAGVIHKYGASPLFSGFAVAVRLANSGKLLIPLFAAGGIAGAVIIMFMSIGGYITKTGNIGIVLLQLLWTLLGSALTFFNAKKN